jgi:alcohol dehydrogenase (NADP+)
MLRLPALGLGLWKAPKGEVGRAVTSSIRAGYRLLDGAAAYGNEAEVGEAIYESIAAKLCDRKDLVVVSKLFNTHHVWKEDASRPEAALKKTLSDLRLDYLDLYLMHWPFSFGQTELESIGGLRGPDGTPNPKLEFEIEFIATWKIMLEMREAGFVKEIGVCNFTVEQLKELLAAFPDKNDWPAVNQVELHPFLQQQELVVFCKERGIAMMAYSPLGSADSYSGKSFPKRGGGPFETPSGGAPLLQTEAVAQIGGKHGKTPAQVLLRWSHQSGLVPLPKSTNPERIAQNLASLDASWSLDDHDMDTLKGLDCGFRYGIGYAKGHYDCPNAPWFESA